MCNRHVNRVKGLIEVPSKGSIVRRETILMIWVGGLVLAAALYAIGPDRFLGTFLDLIDRIDFAVRDLVFVLGAQAYGVVRALAIAIYVVFAAFAILAGRRGHRSFWAVVAVSLTFLMLVWRPYTEAPASISRWFASLILVTIAAVIMTQRAMTPLVGPASRMPGPGPYPPFPPGRSR